MKALLKHTGWFLFNLFLMLWGVYRLTDGVFTGVEMLQTAVVLINLFAAAYSWVLIRSDWKAYRETP